MFHACLESTFLCFVYTLRCFYIFFGTNLLTSCHSASCLFSSVFWFQKGRKSIFSELDGTKPKVNILLWVTRSLEERQRGEPGPPHPPSYGWDLLHAWVGCGPPVRLPASPLFL